jgi:beta-galactosidase
VLPDMAAKCPPARQLLQSLYDYAGSDAFHPTQSLDVSYLDTLLQHGPRGVMQKLGAKILRMDSEVESFEAVNMIDGDPNSIWHTSWGDGAKPLPHEVVISFQKPVKLAGLRILPRQDLDNGKIKDYLVAVSDDDQTWQQAAKGKFDGSAEEKKVLFTQPQTARYLKLTALSAYGIGPFVSIAELVAVEAK